MSKISTYTTHRPIDPTDPGFVIPGRRLRWISGRVSEVYSGRIWTVLRKQDMPEALIKHIESIRPDAFDAGGTFRRHGTELILAYSSEEAAKTHEKSLAESAADQKAKIKTIENPVDKRGHKRQKLVESELTEDFIDQFKRS